MKGLIVLLSFVAVAVADQVCGKNKHFEKCGTACPLTCENWEKPPKVCVLSCNPGCVCDEGFVKTRDSRCVRPQECPRNEPRCDQPHQHYNPCGTYCPLTCDNYSNPPEDCNNRKCNDGCHCDKGYVKTENGQCVPPNMCPPKVEEVMQNTCLAEPDSGLCDAYFPMWYYDVKAESCKKFVYGGCGGNGNRYKTEEECLDHCRDIKMRHDSNICSLPPRAGLCDAYMIRFYFDTDTSECIQFIYGGCGGNKNNFKTLEECKKTCA